MEYIYNESGEKIGEFLIYPKKTINTKPGKTIALVIGHEQSSQGAYGNAGIGEWEFNKDFVDELLLRSGIDDRHTYYVVNRDSYIAGYTNQMIDLHKRIDSLKADISIEFHFNSVTDSSVNGNEVLYCSKAGSKIADILDECLDTLPNRDRGTKKVTSKDRGGAFCCRGKSIAIITEPFFASEQNKFIHDGAERRTLINAYLEFFKMI